MKREARGDAEAPTFEALPMRVGVGQASDLSDRRLRFLKQLGVDDLLLSSLDSLPSNDIEPGDVWPLQELVRVRNRVEEAGLRLFGFEHMPVRTYDLLLDAERREERIGTVAESIRNMGRAGIPTLGHSGHHPDGVWRSSRSKPVRGGAESTAFDAAEFADAPATLDREVTEEALWEAYGEVLEKIVSAAEEAGVTVGLHPSDPPVEELGEIPLIFRDRAAFDRALSMADSEHFGLKLCLGCWSEMGEDIPEVIRHFGGDRIVYIHFRNTIGSVPSFTETFVDDPEGHFDPYEVVAALDDVGFDGVMTPDHVPTMVAEDHWGAGGYSGRAFTVGYLKATIDAVTREG